MIVSGSSISALQCAKISTANSLCHLIPMVEVQHIYNRVLPTVSGRICPLLRLCNVCVRGCMFPVNEE